MFNNFLLICVMIMKFCIINKWLLLGFCRKFHVYRPERFEMTENSKFCVKKENAGFMWVRGDALLCDIQSHFSLLRFKHWIPIPHQLKQKAIISFIPVWIRLLNHFEWVHCSWTRQPPNPFKGQKFHRWCFFTIIGLDCRWKLWNAAR